jgi:hypothetical protein
MKSLRIEIQGPQHRWTIQQTLDNFPKIKIDAVEVILFDNTIGDFANNPHALAIVNYLSAWAPTASKYINTLGHGRISRWWEELSMIPRLTTNFFISSSDESLDAWQQTIANARSYIKYGGCACWVLPSTVSRQEISQCQKLSKKLGFSHFKLEKELTFPEPMGYLGPDWNDYGSDNDRF